MKKNQSPKRAAPQTSSRAAISEVTPIQSDRYARSLIESSLDPLVTISSEGKITDVNLATEMATGKSRAALIGTDFADYFTEPEKARRGYEQVFLKGQVKDYPLALRHRDGHITEVLYNASVYKNEDGDVVGVFAAARDVTERNRAEQEREQYYRFFMLSTEAMCIADPFGCFHCVNPALAKMTGYSEAELISKPFIDFIHPDDRQSTINEMNLQVSQRPSIQFENRYVRKDNIPIYLSWTAYFNKADGATYATARDITERKQSEINLQRVNRALQTLSACNQVLVHTQREQQLLDQVCRLVLDIGGYHMVWIGVPEYEGEQLVRAVASFGDTAKFLSEVKITWADNELGRGPTGTAIRTGKIQANQDFMTNAAMAPWRDSAAKHGYRSSISLPLNGVSGMLGALTIYADIAYAFTDTEIELLRELSEDLVFGIETLRTRADRDRISLENQQYEEVLRSSLEDTIRAIAGTIETRDPYTSGHQRRVGELAVAIAKELALPASTIHGVELAASIHDLGKISIPSEILCKPTKLSEIEFMLLKGHVQCGYDILKDIKFPWPIATMILQHHERLDGSGYPQGLKDDDILLESKILAVADVVEAMMSHRPYRASLGIECALQEIERGRGVTYDAAVADACVRLVKESRFAFTS